MVDGSIIIRDNEGNIGNNILDSVRHSRKLRAHMIIVAAGCREFSRIRGGSTCESDCLTTKEQQHAEAK